MTAREILKRLVAIESLSGEEASVAGELSGILQAGGFTVKRLDNNIWCSLGDGPNTLLFNSHLDVVPPSEGHPYPPFEPTVVDGKLFGRGSVDAKGSVSAMAATLVALAKQGWSAPGARVMGAFTACEESGWPYNGLESTRAHLPPINAAIVGEPTDLHPCVAQKGLLILRLEAAGKSAHAARAHLGKNAILAAARDLRTIEELTLDRVHPVLGPVTVTPTMIDGGFVRNAVPDRCTVHLDVRSTPSYTHEELVALLNEALEGRVVVHSDRLIPVDTDPTEKIVTAASAASGFEPFGSPTTSDWIFLSDVPTVKMGPGSSNLSHTANEHIPLDELDRAVEVYKRTVHNYFDDR